MTLAFIWCMYFPSFRPCCWERFFHYPLWSRSSLSFHLSMDNLASSLSWLLSILGALGNVEMPVSSPVEEVSSAYRAWRRCAWLIALFFFSFPSNPGTFVQVGHFSLPRTPQELFLYPAPLQQLRFIKVISITPPFLWREVTPPCRLSPLSQIINDGGQGLGLFFFPAWLWTVWLRFPSWNWPKLVSETSNRFQFSLEYLPQPISWVLVSWTAPRPSEHPSSRSGGFSVAVMRCVHKAAALTHSPAL